MVRGSTVGKPCGVSTRGERVRAKRDSAARARDRGASAVEYALMVAFVVMAMIGSFYLMGAAFNVKFTWITDVLAGTVSP
jgi:Flp pilus assembly pilin Flp